MKLLYIYVICLVQILLVNPSRTAGTINIAINITVNEAINIKDTQLTIILYVIIYDNNLHKYNF